MLRLKAKRIPLTINVSFSANKRTIQKIAGIVSEISQSSHEQANGIDQINQAIMQIDEVTQKNGQLVEQITSSSSAMLQKVKMLSGLVDQFKSVNCQIN